MSGLSEETVRASGASAGLTGIQLAVGLQFHRAIDYDRPAMRRALVRAGAMVRKEARRLLARRAVSKPGEYPGRQAGDLWRSIGVVSKASKGGWLKVGPRTIKGSVFYPAFLFYGRPKNRYAAAMAARKNFMADALEKSAPDIRSVTQAALRQALVARA